MVVDFVPVKDQFFGVDPRDILEVGLATDDSFRWGVLELGLRRRDVSQVRGVSGAGRTSSRIVGFVHEFLHISVEGVVCLG